MLPLRSRRRILGAGEERLPRLRARFSELEPFVPHTARELGLFRAVSLSAGICEEIVYRGFVMWVAASHAGSFGAALDLTGADIGYRLFRTGGPPVLQRA